MSLIIKNGNYTEQEKNNYKIYSFIDTDVQYEIKLNNPYKTIEYLIVAGGGSGGGEIYSTSNYIKKVRFQRITSKDPTPTYDSRLEINWMDFVVNGVNVAKSSLGATITASPSSNLHRIIDGVYHSGLTFANINGVMKNNYINDGQFYNNWVEIDLSQNYHIDDVQGAFIRLRTQNDGANSRPFGCCFQFVDSSNNIISQSKIIDSYSNGIYGYIKEGYTGYGSYISLGNIAKISANASGGGAGGVISGELDLSNDDFTLTVGSGGQGALFDYTDSSNSSNFPKKGNNSTLNIDNNALIAYGGGSGSSTKYQYTYLSRVGFTNDNSNTDWRNGGSGGGGIRYFQTGGTGISNQGNNGGDSHANQNVTHDIVYPNLGGGGGGASSSGGNATYNLAGSGGAGILSNITGNPVYYAGGGGGNYIDSINGNSGSGGIGGGGSGSHILGTSGEDASSNTGSGGGAGAGARGGNGGSGIIILKIYSYSNIVINDLSNESFETRKFREDYQIEEISETNIINLNNNFFNSFLYLEGVSSLDRYTSILNNFLKSYSTFLQNKKIFVNIYDVHLPFKFINSTIRIASPNILQNNIYNLSESEGFYAYLENSGESIIIKYIDNSYVEIEKTTLGYTINHYDSNNISIFTKNLENQELQSSEYVNHFNLLIYQINKYSTILAEFDYSIAKVRYKRISDSPTQFNIVQLQEMQVWVDNTNVALNGIPSYSSNSFPTPASNLNNNVINQNNPSGRAVSSVSNYKANVGQFILLTLDRIYGFREIQSIVLYNHLFYEPNRAIGCRIELLDNNDQIIYYSPTITSGKNYFRFDGPYFSNASTTSDISTNEIINPTNTSLIQIYQFDVLSEPYYNINNYSYNWLDIWTKNNINPNTAKIKYIRLEQRSSHFWDIAEYQDWNNMMIKRFELWVDVSGVIKNVATRQEQGYNYDEFLYEKIKSSPRAISSFNDDASPVNAFETDQAYQSVKTTDTTGVAYINNINFTEQNVILKSNLSLEGVKKVRLYRNNGDSNSHINISELQVWINGVNKAIGGFVTAGSESTNHPAENINDNNLNNLWHTDNWWNASVQWIEIELTQAHNFNDIESIVIYNRYNRPDIYSRAIGCAIQLRDDSNNILYKSTEITEAKPYYRFDGNSISSGTFSTGPSTSAIVNLPNDTEYLTTFGPEPQQEIRYIELIQDTGASPSDTYTPRRNHIALSSLEIYINSNVLSITNNMISSSNGWNNNKTFENYLNQTNSFFNTAANDVSNSILIDLTQNYSYSVINAIKLQEVTNKNWIPGIKIKLLTENNIVVNASQIPLDANPTESSIIIYNNSSVLPASDYTQNASFISNLQVGVESWKDNTFIELELEYTYQLQDIKEVFVEHQVSSVEDTSKISGIEVKLFDENYDLLSHSQFPRGTTSQSKVIFNNNQYVDSYTNSSEVNSYGQFVNGIWTIDYSGNASISGKDFVNLYNYIPEINIADNPELKIILISSKEEFIIKLYNNSGLIQVANKVNDIFITDSNDPNYITNIMLSRDNSLIPCLVFFPDSSSNYNYPYSEYFLLNTSSPCTLGFPKLSNILQTLNNERFYEIESKEIQEILVDTSNNTIFFTNNFFNKFNFSSNLSDKISETKELLNRMLSFYSSSLGSNKILINSNDINLGYSFSKEYIKIINTSLLVNNVYNPHNDLSDNEGFFMHLENINDFIILENLNNSYVKIEKTLSGYDVNHYDTSNNSIFSKNLNNLFIKNISYKNYYDLITYSLQTISGELADSVQYFTFDFTGQEEEIILDSSYNKAEIAFEAYGACGGSGYGVNNKPSIIGGKGAKVSGVINFVNLFVDLTLFVNVGGKGESNYINSNIQANINKDGGYNGGGKGCSSTNGRYEIGGGGGGATHISLKSGLLSTLEGFNDDILFVAAGGGGSGSSRTNNLEDRRPGGDSENDGVGEYKGLAATNLSPGIGGERNGQTGSFGQGGNGYAPGIISYKSGGGGGGSGFYGGGGGGQGINNISNEYRGGGGGGGSNYFSSEYITFEEYENGKTFDDSLYQDGKITKFEIRYFKIQNETEKENNYKNKIVDDLSNKTFEFRKSKLIPEIEEDLTSNIIKFNTSFFNSFTRLPNITLKNHSKFIIRQIFSSYTNSIQNKKVLVGKNDIELPFNFTKSNIRILKPNLLTNNTLSVGSDLEPDEGFYIDLENTGDFVFIKNEDESYIKLEKTESGFTINHFNKNNISIFTSDLTDSFITESGFSSEFGLIKYTLGTISGETVEPPTKNMLRYLTSKKIKSRKAKKNSYNPGNSGSGGNGCGSAF